MILRVSRHPVKAALIAFLLAIIAFGGLVAHTEYKVRSLVRPLFQELARLSDTHQEQSQLSWNGMKWSGTFHLREESLNQQGQQAILTALRQAQWDVGMEGSVILGNGLVGGFYAIATNNERTLIAYLPKSGGELRVNVAKTGQPEVSGSPESLPITGR